MTFTGRNNFPQSSQQATADTAASGAHTSDLSLSSDRSQGTVQRIAFPVSLHLATRFRVYILHEICYSGAKPCILLRNIWSALVLGEADWFYHAWPCNTPSTEEWVIGTSFLPIIFFSCTMGGSLLPVRAHRIVLLCHCLASHASLRTCWCQART